MTSENLESMWKIMRTNNFEINENINSEYLCTICKGILINACYAPCGCRYCKCCITDYLKEERQACPGTSEFCKDEVINIDSDIHVHQAINTRISRLIVKCPNMSCQTKVDLKSMKNHLETCGNRFVICPFINIGCEEDKLSIDKVNEHLSSEVNSHSKLLMDWVNISRNEMELLKKDMELLRSENYDLKEKMENTEKAEMENKIEIDKLSDEMSYLKNENRFLKEELEAIQNQIADQISNSELRTKLEKQNQEIDKLKQEYQNRETKAEIQENKNRDLEIKLNEISQANNAMRTESMEMIHSIVKIREFIHKSWEFIWKIDNWSYIRRDARNGTVTEIYSDSFFSHKYGYQIYLCAYPDGFDDGKGTHLSLYFHIMKGPFDDILEWPFKHDVEFSLIDQQSGLAYYTHAVGYSDDPDNITFTKPVNYENCGYGTPTFMKLEEISKNRAISRGNQIFIKCVVKFV